MEKSGFPKYSDIVLVCPDVKLKIMGHFNEWVFGSRQNWEPFLKFIEYSDTEFTICNIYLIVFL